MLVNSLQFEVTNPYEGIYYINKDGFFPIQLIVAKELDKASHIWLTSLTDDMSEEDARRLLQETDILSEKEAQEISELTDEQVEEAMSLIG